jgi:hypothetical protein
LWLETGEIFIMERFMIFCHWTFSDYQIKEHEMGGAFGTFGRKNKLCRVLIGTPEGREDLEDLGEDGSIVL